MSVSVEKITHCANAHQILEAIIQHIFLHETQRHQKCIDTIAETGGIWQGAFLFKAQTYRKSSGTTGRASLPEHCWDDMELFLKDKTMVERDSRQMWQLLFSAIFPCTSLQDVRDVLPDMVVSFIPELNQFPRTREEMWTVKDDQRLMRQYKEVRERIELYVKLRDNPQFAKLISFYHYEV